MREVRPRNLKDTLAEAEYTRRLAVGSAYAAPLYSSEDFLEEGFRLEECLNDLVFIRSRIISAGTPSPSSPGMSRRS